MKTPKHLQFTTISKELDGKQKQSVLQQVKSSYWRHYNASLSIKENFIVWAHDVQGMSYVDIGEVLSLKKSQIGNIYNFIKKNGYTNQTTN